MTLPKGTLVRILDDAVPPHQDSEMRRAVTNHGHLWLIDELIRGYSEDAKPTWYWCKALSSGVIYDWREDEFETAEQSHDATT